MVYTLSSTYTSAPGQEEMAYNALMLDVQQRFLKHKENTSSRLQQIEDMLELAVHKLCLSKQVNAAGYEEELTNPIVWKYTKDMPSMATSVQEKHKSLKHLKLKFPVFQGNIGVRTWLKDCEQYFDNFEVEDSKKVVIAGMHLEGVPKSWYQSYVEGAHAGNWKVFGDQFAARFETEKEELVDANFKKMKQITMLEPYISQFEKGKQGTTTPVAHSPLQLGDNYDEKNVVWKGEPIYDEELEECQECWPEQRFILAALKGEGYISEGSGKLQGYPEFLRFDEEPKEVQELGSGKEVILAALNESAPNFPNPIPFEVCTREKSEDTKDPLVVSPLQVIQQIRNNSGAMQRLTPSYLEDCLEVEKPQHCCKQDNQFLMEAQISSRKATNNGQSYNMELLAKGQMGTSRVDDESGRVVCEVKQQYVQSLGQVENEMHKSLCLYCPKFEDFQQICKQVCMFIMSKEDFIKSLANKSNKVPKNDEEPRFAGSNRIEEQDIVEEEASTILANRRELIESVPCGDSAIAPNSCGFEKKFTPLDRQIMIIFDPGGLVQKDHLKSVTVIFQDMIRMKEGMLEELALNNLACGQWGQLQEETQGQEILGVQEETSKVFGMNNPQKVTSGKVRRQVIPHIYQYMNLKHTSRPELNWTTVGFTIYIFDPGGDHSCFQGVLLSVSTGITRLQKLLQSFFNRKLEEARATMRTWLISRREECQDTLRICIV